MNTDSLEKFIFLANTHGYGSSSVDEEKLPNGENVIRFSDSQFELKDVYYGGEPYAGQEVVFYENRAVWAMQYRGSVVSGEELSSLYAFIGKALTNTKLGQPRGVDGFSNNDFVYNVSMEGNLSEFKLVETIRRSGNLVYRAEFLGGLVDARREA